MKYTNKIKNKIKKMVGLAFPTVEELRVKGVTIGENVSINTKYIDDGHGFLISIGDNVTIAVNAIILAHDASTKSFLGYSKVGRVNIGNNVFIGGGAIILPNVCIGDNVIIGAGAIVNHDIPCNSVAVGNPAKVIGTFDEYIEKNKKLLSQSPVFNTYWKDKTSEEIECMKQKIQIGKIGFDI